MLTTCVGKKKKNPNPFPAIEKNFDYIALTPFEGVLLKSAFFSFFGIEW